MIVIGGFFLGKFLDHFFINSVASSFFIPNRTRQKIYRKFGITLEDSSVKLSPKIFFGGTNVVIGSGSFVNVECFFDNNERITLGKCCDIGMGTMFVTSNHDLGSKKKRAGKVVGKPIVIGDGVWIGARVIVLPGITIGDGCIVAAGAVITKDCKPNGLYAGVPAKRLKELD